MLSIKFGIHPCSQHHFKPPCPQTPSAPDSTEYNDFPLISVPNPPPYHPDLLTHQPFFGFVCVCVCSMTPPPPRPHPFPKFNQYFLTSALHIFPDLLPSQSIISIPHTSPSLIAFMHPNRLPAHPHQHPHLCLSDDNQHSSEDRSYNHEWIRRQSTWKHTPERLWMPNTHLKRKHTYATEGSGLLSHFRHPVSSCEIRFNPFTADRLYHWCSFLPRSLSRKGWTD